MLSPLLKRSKQSYFSKFFESNWNNIKNTWKRIKSLITLNCISTSVPMTLNHNNETATNSVEIAKIFNNHFAFVAEKTRTNVNYSQKHFSEYIENNSISFFLFPTNKNEILSIISSLNTNKYVGPNSIPTEILKLLKDETSFHLSDIYNISFSMGVFPSVLKTTKVISVHKKDSKLDCNNYCPIFLLPNIEKNLEKLVYNRITKFLNDNNLIYPLQFRFQHTMPYSTNYALINLTEDIRKNLDEEKVGCGIFINLKKAFDTVDHNILLAKLKHYGITWCCK